MRCVQTLIATRFQKSKTKIARNGAYEIGQNYAEFIGFIFQGRASDAAQIAACLDVGFLKDYTKSKKLKWSIDVGPAVKTVGLFSVEQVRAEWDL